MGHNWQEQFREIRAWCTDLTVNQRLAEFDPQTRSHLLIRMSAGAWAVPFLFACRTFTHAFLCFCLGGGFSRPTESAVVKAKQNRPRTAMAAYG